MLFITFLFSLLSAIFAKNVNKNRIGKKNVFMLSAFGLINFIFTALCLFVSNPFARSVKNIEENLVDGLGLNPILQHPVATIHPPIIFITYMLCLYIAVCSTCVFFIKGNHNKLISEIKKFSFFAWISCSFAILSGAFWAYQEAGWGGYWSWDPVECSALLNWLLISSLYILLREDNKYKNKKIISTLGVLVLRNDVEVTSETMSGDWDGEKMVQFDEEVFINQEPVRVQEFGLKLTPRMAVNLHTALTRELEDLPPEIAKQYGIEKME
jgi:cytochrome c biogenesis factor